MERVVDRLRDRDETFRRTWDLFRLVFGQPLSDFGAPGRPEDHDKITGIRGYRTLNNEVVKSQEERLIANWLFYHGVRYEYERPYEVGTATARHGQYHPDFYYPDFYYPDIDAYHEHWAIDRDGNPPPTFKVTARACAGNGRCTKRTRPRCWRPPPHPCATAADSTTSPPSYEHAVS